MSAEIVRLESRGWRPADLCGSGSGGPECLRFWQRCLRSLKAPPTHEKGGLVIIISTLVLKERDLACSISAQNSQLVRGSTRSPSHLPNPGSPSGSLGSRESKTDNPERMEASTWGSSRDGNGLRPDQRRRGGHRASGSREITPEG